MKHKVKLENVLVLIEYGTIPIAAWPVPPDAPMSAVLRKNFCWWFGFVHMVLTTLSFNYNIYLNINDIDIVVPILSELCTVLSTLAKMVICKRHTRSLQGLIAELRAFLKEATDEEMKVVESYVDQCFVPQFIVFICAIVGPLAFILLPIVIKTPLPGATAYPFSLNRTWVHVSLYCSHTLGGCMIGCIHILDFLFVMLIWLAGVKFEVLAMELERATNVDDVKRCMRKHQEVLAYVERMKPPIRAMSVEVATVAVFAVTTGGFVVIRHPPLIRLLEYILFEFISGMELYLFCWPADNLIKTSERIRDAAFGSDWVGKSRAMRQDLLFAMQRSRFPEVISVTGVMPPLTLEFFGSNSSSLSGAFGELYLQLVLQNQHSTKNARFPLLVHDCMSASFSYLTTLRAMAHDET